MEIANFTSLAYLDAKSMAKVFDSYAEQCAMEEIFSVGFNPSSGDSFLALENGVSITSGFNQNASFLVANHKNGEETFFDSYKEALRFLYDLNDSES